MSTGVVLDIKRTFCSGSDSISTVVLLKGCLLRCLWCCNPESQRGEPELMLLAHRCVACGRCLEVCPSNAVVRDAVGAIATDRRTCRACGTCADACLGEARLLKGRRVSVDDVFREVGMAGALAGSRSAGLIASGGEPLLQAAFVAELLAAGKRRGLNTAVETCGLAPWEDFRRILPHANTIFFDIKHTDSHTHRRLTGVGNDLILANLHRLVASGVNVVARAPLVPGCNADPQSVRAIAGLVRHLGIPELHLLPYHRQGEAKYRALGRGYPLDGAVPLSEDVVERLREVAEAVGGLRAIVDY